MANLLQVKIERNICVIIIIIFLSVFLIQLRLIHASKLSGEKTVNYDFRLMTQKDALIIANEWKYSGKYAFYDFTADPEDYAELINPSLRKDHYYSIFNSDNSELIGFTVFEIRENQVIEIGLGMKPALTGHGNGSRFVQAIINFGISRYPQIKKIQLDVADFNQRAISTYEKLGFKKIKLHRQETNGSIYNFWLLEKTVSKET